MKMNAQTIGWVIFALLLLSGALITWLLVSGAKPAPSARNVVARNDLPAYHLLTREDLEMMVGAEWEGSKLSEEDQASIDRRCGRRLMKGVSKGDPVSEDSLAPQAATRLLADAVFMSIPATPASTIGGSLRPGEMVDLIATPPPDKGPRPSDEQQRDAAAEFEDLLVIDVPKSGDAGGGILLALPRAERNRFASAIAGASVSLARRVRVDDPRAPKS